MLSGEVLAGKMLIDYQGEGRNRLELPVMQFLLQDPQSTKENGEFQISRELEGSSSLVLRDPEGRLLQGRDYI